MPGDVVLHRPSSIKGWMVAVKTYTHISHLEVYIGEGKSISARYPTGVHVYPFLNEHIAYILRPDGPLDIPAGLRWFYSEADGQKFDFWGQMVFFLAARHGAHDRMWCSELGVRFLRHCGHHPFARWWDADRTPPSLFLASPHFDMVWHDGCPM